MCSVYNNHTHHFHLFKHLSFIFALFGDHGFHFLVLLIKTNQQKQRNKKNWKWTQGPLMRTWEISNLGGKLPGGRRQKRQRPNLGAGRGQENRKVQLWRFEQLHGRVVFTESENLQMPSLVGFGFWPVSERGKVKHYASSKIAQKEVGRLSSDISKWLHRPKALKSFYTALIKG